jgi:hypothetical protein
MKKSFETIKIKTQVTIRKDVWERVCQIHCNQKPSKLVFEAIRRWWEQYQPLPPQSDPELKAVSAALTPFQRLELATKLKRWAMQLETNTIALENPTRWRN